MPTPRYAVVDCFDCPFEREYDAVSGRPVRRIEVMKPEDLGIAIGVALAHRVTVGHETEAGLRASHFGSIG